MNLAENILIYSVKYFEIQTFILSLLIASKKLKYLKFSMTLVIRTHYTSEKVMCHIFNVRLLLNHSF